VKKVYATARDVTAMKNSDTRVEVHALDITDHAAVNALAEKLTDVDLLINNAGINAMSAFAASDSMQGARDEMEVNYFGTLAMCRAFAPVLKRNGGGAIVNMLSILSRVNLPLMGSLCASKAAGLSLVQGMRAELAGQQTAVVAVMPGAVDTDMSKDFPPPKMAPADVVSAALDGLEAGLEEIYPGEMASGLSEGLAADPKAVEKELAAYLP
jgi:short-subunit dehydrogenase